MFLNAAVGSCATLSETQACKVNEHARGPSKMRACCVRVGHRAGPSGLLSKTLAMVQTQNSKPACDSFRNTLVVSAASPVFSWCHPGPTLAK